MISKNKQDYEIEMHFDPTVIRSKKLDWPNNISYFVVRDSTAPFGDRIRCEFVEVKNFKEHEKRVAKLRKFAKGLKSYNFEPISVLVQNNGKLYSGSVMCNDGSIKEKRNG